MEPSDRARSINLPSSLAERWLSLRRLARELALDLANREGPDITWITEDLAIGGQILPEEWPTIAAAGIRAVVDCRFEACDPVDVLRDLDIAFLHLPTADASAFSLEMVTEGVDWIEHQLAAGRRTLIHCQAGRGRSVLIGAAVLTRRGLAPEDAVEIIRARRPIITPTPGQMRRLREFAANGWHGSPPHPGPPPERP